MSFILRLKRADTPVFAFLKSAYRFFTTSSLPVPRAVKPIGHLIYNLHYSAWLFGNRLITFFYREPLFRSRCEHVGKRLTIYLMPEAWGHTSISIGDDVVFQGKCGIYSGRVNDRAMLRIGDRVSVGHGVTFSCNESIVVESHVLIANNCTIADNDGHPLDADLRAAGMPPPASHTRPVRICEKAWIGAGSYILKGVTVGPGAVVGAGSVVSKDIPPFAIAVGNPARVLRILAPDETASEAGSAL
jgi:acetyltransferase-like isoleucine patch superfamily enzyme